jgi:hypothetical protein
MNKNLTAEVRNPLLMYVFILGLMVSLIVLPSFFLSEAGGKKSKGLLERTESHGDGLENYDIRADKSAFEKLAQFRGAAGKDSAMVADIRANFVRGEELLKAKVPTLKVEYNTDIRTPEVIAPEVKLGRTLLTAASNNHRAEILRDFVKENENLIGVSGSQANQLKITADYTNPNGNLSFAHLEQFVGGVPVFRGEIKAGFTRQGEIIRVINNLAPALDYQSLSTDFRNPLDAVKSAAVSINLDANKLDLTQNEAASSDLKVTFGTGDSATTAEKMYFPTEPGVARAAWRVLIWQPVNAYYVIVDAETGTMLWRKNITEDQTQPATYSVYRNSNAMIDVADNPFPFTPGPTSPNGTQGAAISRVGVSRIGNEGVYSFNNNGWINDAVTVTDGNAIQAGLDRDGVDGVDANSEAVSATRDFTFSYNPFNPNTNTGDAPIPVPQTYPGSAFQQGTTTQLFWISNWYHDELYRLGFTEQARNFQNDNFGRGGLGADRIRGEGQDSSGTNNANFSTPADGGRGRMQMYIWTGPNPDIDGNLDAEVVIHEITHGTSNRLHGNGSGLSTNMSRGMGEGWSDFYAHCLLSEPSDPINGIYTTGGYDTYRGAGGGTFVNNYYYGIRRFPKAVRAFTGGGGNLPHNPLTFADADGTQINTTDGAFARGPFGSTTADQVHNLGEIWSSALWEVRAKFVQRLGWADGNRRTLQYVTDGMKLAPLGPTFLQERDAIIAAAQASLPMPQASQDVADIWAGFAIRGMGASAIVTASGTGASNTRVIEASDLPNLTQTPNFTVSDSTGDNDGYAEPGEPVVLNIPLFNNTGINADNTTLQLVGGGSANYGTVVNNGVVSRTINYTVPANTSCGSTITLNFNVNSSLGATSFSRIIIIGVPQTTFAENFDGVTAPAFPSGWTATVVQSGQNFVNSTINPDSAPNSAFAVNPATVGGGTDLTSPSMPITASAAVVSFRNHYDTESGWDGGALEISVNGGAFQDIITAGGRFIENGYNGTLGAGTNNPLANRATWSGFSNGYLNSSAQLPASAAGQNVQLRWRFGADDNTVGQGPNPGWYVDGVKVAGNYGCLFTPTSVKSRADFDGDGKTDLSVFRPSEGNWYLNRSTLGVVVANWGLASDILTPGDYDGDNKTDVAIFRPSTGEWYILRSSDGGFSANSFGANGDIPVPGDYDGDNRTDLAVYRPLGNLWFIFNSSSNTPTIVQFGVAGDIPVRGDYDGDGKTDIAIYRTGAWWVLRSSGGFSVTGFGLTTDKAVPADYDGDGKDDYAVYRPSEGQWYILRTSDAMISYISFGISTDIPVPGDYDGDGKDDPAVYRNGTWYLNQSTAGVFVTNFGVSTDTAIPTKYIP